MIPPLRRDKKHVYWLGKSRKPGFTEIATAMGVIRSNPFYTEQGREEGTRLSEWLKFLCEGRTPTEPPHSSIAVRVEAIKKFIRDTGFTIIEAEVPHYDSVVDACCTPDIVGYVREAVHLYDAKRGSKMNWHPLQTAAQAGALSWKGVIVERRSCLYLKKNGKYDTSDEHKNPFDYENWKRICRAFHLMLPAERDAFRDDCSDLTDKSIQNFRHTIRPDVFAAYHARKIYL